MLCIEARSTNRVLLKATTYRQIWCSLLTRGETRNRHVGRLRDSAKVASKYLGTHGSSSGSEMAEIINLRKARKEAKRADDARRAAENRLAHGRSKAERASERKKAERYLRDLEAHRIDTGEGT